MTDIFQEVKDRVSTQEAARYYGFQPNRAGFICCPFHGEKTPSLKLYPGAGGFHCFGCHTGGSVIDFVGLLLGLEPMAAVERLNADFGLALPLYRQPTQVERQEAQRRREVNETINQFEAWRGSLVSKLNACFRVAHLALKSLETPADLDRLTASQVLAIREQAYFEWVSDVLTGGTMAEQIEIFRQRKEMAELCEKILNSTQTKSGAA